MLNQALVRGLFFDFVRRCVTYGPQNTINAATAKPLRFLFSDKNLKIKQTRGVMLNSFQHLIS